MTFYKLYHFSDHVSELSVRQTVTLLQQLAWMNANLFFSVSLKPVYMWGRPEASDVDCQSAGVTGLLPAPGPCLQINRSEAVQHPALHRPSWDPPWLGLFKQTLQIQFLLRHWQSVEQPQSTAHHFMCVLSAVVLCDAGSSIGCSRHSFDPSPPDLSFQMFAFYISDGNLTRQSEDWTRTLVTFLWKSQEQCWGLKWR